MSGQEEVQDFILPKNFIPRHYEISLQNLDVAKLTFEGHVQIHFQCDVADDKVYLNCRNLGIEKLQLTRTSGQPIEVVSQGYDRRLEAIIIYVNGKITSDFIADVDYQGVIHEDMSGFYLSRYRDVKTNENKIMLSTQFEATDAREAFPCIDEPARKATFKMSIIADSQLTVLSNMPEKEIQLVKNDDKIRHIFHTTPLMSTYLVAWAIGEYEFIEGNTDKEIYPISQDPISCDVGALPIRVYTAIGKKNQGKFALSVATKVVDLFSELFKIPYPLPKLDLLCVESYSHNAMENFSLITFRPTALLIEDKDDDVNPSALQKVAYVVCHEIAHQWFGNLVTMQWWDELWLNEGFATWAGFYAVSNFFPHWDVESMVMLESHEVALQLDVLKESHPVKVTVRDPKDIDQVFDAISYLKGCSVIEMLSGYLGQQDFLSGVALYLRRNKWGNATMGDLFHCIGEISKLDILSKIEPWILEPGYPILQVNKLSLDALSVIQSNPNSDKLRWIPLLLTRDGEFCQKSGLVTKSTELHIGSKYTLFNTDGKGFYRVKYESLRLVDDNIDQLSSRSKIGLLADVYSLAPLPDYLKLVNRTMKVHDPKDFYVWKFIHSSLLKTRSIIYNSCVRNLLRKFDNYILRLVEPWIDVAIFSILENSTAYNNSNDPDTFSKSLFYQSILSLAGKLSHPKVVTIANKLYETSELNTHNKSIVLGVVLSQKDTSKANFDKAVSKLDGALLHEMETILTCLGSVTNPKLFESCLQLLFKVEPMNVQFLAKAFMTNPSIHLRILSFLQQNGTALIDRLSINQAVIGRFLASSFAYCQGEETALMIRSIFENQNFSAYDRVLKQTLEKIGANTKYHRDNSASLEVFLKGPSYSHISAGGGERSSSVD